MYFPTIVDVDNPTVFTVQEEVTFVLQRVCQS
jgi:hypothetical protein